jgi:hypothetical protein
MIRQRRDGERCNCECGEDGHGDKPYKDYVPEPDIDDTVRCCPECERPNQFGELCESCHREQGEQAREWAN